MNITDRVRQAAMEAGADLVGFAPISRFVNAPPLYHPHTIFPQTQTVIAVAVRILSLVESLTGSICDQRG